jgi:hypothetical protein
LGSATRLAQSVLPDDVSGHTIIEMLSELELAPSLPKDGLSLENMVRGVAAAMDCLCSWTTALELYQYEEVDHVEVDDESRLGDKLEVMSRLGDRLDVMMRMKNDVALTPKRPVSVPVPFTGASAYQGQSTHRTADTKPSKKHKYKDV